MFIWRDKGFALWVNVAQLDIEIQPHYKGHAHNEGLWVEILKIRCSNLHNSEPVIQLSPRGNLKTAK